MNKLERMLKYVSEHNDFYKRRIEEYGITNPIDINQWPILTRKELQNNRYNMFSDGYKMRYYNQQLKRQSSSGSTGVPVNVYWDYSDWYASNMHLWRKRANIYHVFPNDKQVSFDLSGFSQPSGGDFFYINAPVNILNINISTPRSVNQYKRILSIIRDFEPKWLRIRPFFLQILVNTYKNLNEIPPKSIEYIETYGECLEIRLKELSHQLFGAEIVELYGTEELNGIAFENHNNEMEILSDNVFVEVKTHNGISQNGSGGAIVTSLSNHSMPMIRYEIGDHISISSSTYNNSAIVNSVIGRTIEHIITNDDVVIAPTLLLEIIGEVNNIFGQIIVYYKYVFHQMDLLLECFVTLDDYHKNWEETVREQLESIYVKRFPQQINVRFIVTFLEEIPMVQKKHKIIEVINE